jgi:peptidoglycan/xylan/chitin deacetylase (PgdA/CDA1 family)
MAAPAGLRHQLPSQTGGLYVLLYHGVRTDQMGGLRHHLEALLDRGAFLGWEQSLAALTGADPLAGPCFCLTFDDGHKEWRERVLPLLQEHNLSATFFISTDKVVDGESREHLTWQDCRVLVDAGMSIGSHSVSHRRLFDLPAWQAEREVVDSRDILEQRLGIPIRDFALPYGLPDLDYSARDLQLLRDVGYRSIASALPGRMDVGHPLTELLRCGLSPAWPLMAVRTRVHE